MEMNLLNFGNRDVRKALPMYDDFFYNIFCLYLKKKYSFSTCEEGQRVLLS